jgi:hypothetical protein
MRATIITLAATTAMAFCAGSANALPPTYFTNPSVVYPTPYNGGFQNSYYSQNGYYSPAQGYSYPNYGNSNRRYSGVTRFGPSSGSGALHPAPMSWQFANPGYRRWNR